MATIENATEIHPFHVDVPEEELADLRSRIAATRWPEGETVADGSQGVQLATMQELVRYWVTEYDFRRFTAATRRTRSMCWFRRCPATGSRGNQRLPAGTLSTSRTPGSS